MEHRIKAVMSAVFGVAEKEIGEDASPETMAVWDSLKHMNLIIALEEEFGVQFSDDQFVELMSYDSIRSALAGAAA